MLRASLLKTPEWRNDPKPHKCFDSNCAHHISGFSSRQACQDHVDTCHGDALVGYQCLFEGCNLFIPGRLQMDAHMREEHGWIHSTCADIHGGCLVGDPMSCLRLTQTWKMPSITGSPSPSARQTPASNAWLSEHHPSPAVHSIQTAQGSDMQMSTGSGAGRRHSRSSELSTRWTPRDQSIGLPVPLDTPSRQPWSPAIQTNGHESGVIYHSIESDAGSYMSEHQQGQDWTAWMPKDLLPPTVQSAQPYGPSSQYDDRSATEPIWGPEAVHVTSSQIRPRYTFQLSASEPIEALSNSPLRVHSQRTIDVPGQRAEYSAVQAPLRWFNDPEMQYYHYTGTLYPQVQAPARSADQYPSHPSFAEAELPHLLARCCDLPHHALHLHYNYDDWRMYDDWGAQLSPTWMLF